MADIEVRYEDRDRFRVRARSHAFVVDQPTDVGGDDLGPMPTELFVASLATCVGFFAERYLRRHDLPTDGLAIDCDFTMTEDRPARVSAISLSVVVPEGFPEAKRKALNAVIEHCTVHNSIMHAPEIAITLDARERIP